MGRILIAYRAIYVKNEDLTPMPFIEYEVSSKEFRKKGFKHTQTTHRIETIQIKSEHSLYVYENDRNRFIRII